MSDEEMERILGMSDEELRWELRAEGLDPDEIADDGPQWDEDFLGGGE